MAKNPFKPTAGKTPPILIGRDYVLDDFQEALDNGAGAPGRLMLISGNRGYGKTVLLREIEKIAKQDGWFTVSENASAGLIERLTKAVKPAKNRLKSLNINPSIGIGGIASASLGSASFDDGSQAVLTLRESINERLKEMEPGKGVLFIVDEVQGFVLGELSELAITVQHIIGDQDQFDVPDEEKKGIAFVFAALPSSIEDLQNEEHTTFIRRAIKEELENVYLPDVRDAYIDVVQTAGKSITVEVALRAAQESEGHPYLIQLVGYYMWREAERRGSDAIEDADVRIGKDNALLAFYDAVCAPVYYGIRSPERLFVEAMAQDEGEFSEVSSIATRCGRSKQWVAKYRTNLIKQRIIEPVGYGQVRCIVPYLKEYIREKVLWRG